MWPECITRNRFEKRGDLSAKILTINTYEEKCCYKLQTYVQCGNNYLSLLQYHENPNVCHLSV